MNQQLLDRVLQSPRLPSLPSIALQVIDLVQLPNVDLSEMAETIQNDPALAGKILKTVNSSFYGQPYTVSTVSQALVILGLNSVKTLALGFSLTNHLKAAGGGAFNHLDYWKRSLYAATAARKVACLAGLPQAEEVFLGALMQDLGMLVLNQTIPEDYAPIIAETGGDHGRLIHVERDRLGLDHAEVGAALARSWNLPPLLVAPIQWHESPESAPGEVLPMVRCVALGNRVAGVYMSDAPGESLQAYYTVAQEWFGLGPAAAEPLLRDAHTATREMRRLFDLPTGELGNADQVLARANEALLQLSLQSVRQTSQLQRQNQLLAEQASTDSLTGAANRRRFNEVITAAFARAGAAAPLSVLFLDTDHFKRFNDTYGHATGDRVLVEVAALLRAMLPAGGIVARYGGEEFAVVLPKTDRRSAARLAEEIRLRLEAAIVKSDDGRDLHVTASIGLATYEGTCFQRVEQLVKAADRAVYAAKAAGRNCVRVFTPRPIAAV